MTEALQAPAGGDDAGVGETTDDDDGDAMAAAATATNAITSSDDATPKKAPKEDGREQVVIQAPSDSVHDTAVSPTPPVDASSGDQGQDSAQSNGNGGAVVEAMDVDGEAHEELDEAASDARDLAAFAAGLGGDTGEATQDKTAGTAAVQAHAEGIAEVAGSSVDSVPDSTNALGDAESGSAPATAVGDNALQGSGEHLSAAQPMTVESDAAPPPTPNEPVPPVAVFRPTVISATTARVPPASSSQDTYAYEEEQERLTMLKNLHQPMRKWFNEAGNEALRPRFGSFPLFWQVCRIWSRPGSPVMCYVFLRYFASLAYEHSMAVREQKGSEYDMREVVAG